MVIRSAFRDVEIPDEPLTGFVLARAGEFGDTAALIDAPTAERSRPPNSRRCCSPMPPTARTRPKPNMAREAGATRKGGQMKSIWVWDGPHSRGRDLLVRVRGTVGHRSRMFDRAGDMTEGGRLR